MSKQTTRGRLRSPLVAAAAVVLVAAAAATALAAPELRYETGPTEPTSTDKHPPPTVRVTVIGGVVGLTADRFALKQVDGNFRQVRATSVTRYVDGPEPLGLVVVVQGDATWLGKVGNSLSGALTSLAEAAPPGSQAMVLLFDKEVTVAKPAGPLKDLATFTIPVPEAGGKATRDLNGALKRALAELDKMSAPRKGLVVISDGVDGAGSKQVSAAMRELGSKLEEKKITSFAVMLPVEDPKLGAPVEPPIKLDPNGMEIIDPVLQDKYDSESIEWRRIKDQAFNDLKALTNGQATRINSPKNLDTTVGTFATLVDDRYYLTFPGYDRRSKAGFKWDGKDHQLMLKIDGQDTVATSVTMTPKWSPPTKGSRWWLWLLISGGAVALLAGLVAMFKKPEPIPPPPPVAMPAGPPPGPAKPQKTQFIALDEGTVFPMVGWLCFLNGPKRLKFHKLKPGVTKVGTAGNSDIVIDDGYMSTDHAVIMMSPDGWFLQDNNSTNGTYVNRDGQEDKLGKDRHELWDNDIVRFGKTMLVFKAVM